MRSRNYVIYSIIGLLVVSSISYSMYSYLTDRDGKELFISTTTSVENTGLLDLLISEFERSSDLEVKYSAVGSGAAIQLARDGEVDAVLVHAPDLEQELLDDGYSSFRNTLWYNHFILAGPAEDPAGIASSASLQVAMDRIYEAGIAGKTKFFSRGDNSGTHIKELQLWKNSSYSINPRGDQDWYIETGTGMSATLTTADSLQGYTLSDIGTFATLMDSETPIDLAELFGNDSLLYNPYSYLVINQAATGTDLNTKGAEEFLGFLQLESTRRLVENYTVGDIVLFTPIATEN